MSKKVEILIFNKPGPANTRETVAFCVKTAIKERISHIVVTSSYGNTALEAIKVAKALKYKGKIVVVGYHIGFKEEGKQVMPKKAVRKLEAAGASVFFGTHALSGVARSFSGKFGGLSIPEIIANSLKRFGQGIKVCVEVSMMAADAGLIPVTKNVIAIGGSGRGADAAIILRSCNQSSFFKMKIRRILCMPE